jgi:hypothetical protein
MKVLGVVPGSSDLKWALVDGVRASPILLSIPTKGQKLPSDPVEGRALQSLYRLISTFLTEQGVCRVCILHAGNSQFGGPSALRVKAEGILQLAAADSGITALSIPPQTLRAREKRFVEETGGTPEAILNAGDAFVPKPWRDAVLNGMGGVAGMSTTREDIINIIKAASKYELRDENTEGMNAYAFVARHRPLDRDVFLKVYDADPSSAELFREPRFLVEVTHGDDRASNLVEIYDAELLGDQYVLVAMEYVDGGSILRQLESGPFGLMDAIGSAVGLLHGVARLHAAGLVHRDIKPANVLLTRRGDLWVPKLGDFGSVARLASPIATVSASRHSALYVPPEGWAEPSCYGIRSDLYQVGMVLHEMVNGALP